MFFFSIILLAASFLRSCVGETYNDDFVLNFDSPVYVCGDETSESFLDTAQVELRRINESTACLAGNINFLKGLDHGTLLEILVQKEANGQFEIVFSLVICDVCKEVGNPDSHYKTYLQYFGFPDSCPFEPKEYNILDLVASDEDLPINGANSGRYQSTVNMYKVPEDGCSVDDGEFIACAKLDLIVEPK